MADDITLTIKDIRSIANSIKIFNDFEKCLKLYLSKTELIQIGNKRVKVITLPTHLEKIKIKHGLFKALGCGSL